MSAKNKKTILLLLVAAVLLAVIPFFAKKGAEFGGSDDAGSVKEKLMNHGLLRLLKVLPEVNCLEKLKV